MATVTTDWKWPGAAGSLANGGASADWMIQEGDILASDNVFGAQVGGMSDAESKFLHASNFGFAVPAGATILGVEVRVNAKTSSISPTAPYLDTAKLVVSGSIAGTDTGTPQNLTTSEVAYSLGAADNVWGCTLTAAIVNASNFGLGVSVHGYAGETISVDDMSMRLTYEEAPSGPAAGQCVQAVC